MIAPPGMSRLGSGYLSVIDKAWPLLKFIRVTGTGALAASANLVNGATTICVVALKYVGAAGNNCTWTVGSASDGNVNHFNLTVSVTGASGTTTDVIHNVDMTATGPTVSATDLASALLVGSITKSNTGTPTNNTGSFTAGSDGTITATNYVGTQGAQDQGIALMEGDNNINFHFSGDPGNTLRSAVNAGHVAHANYMSDRVAVINGNSGQTLSAAQTDSANYQSEFVVYCDPWVYELDDTTGAQQFVPGSSFAASVACQTSPSTSIGWKSDEMGRMLQGVVQLEFNRGQAAFTNTNAGIVTFIQNPTGGFRFEAGKVTVNPVTPAKGNLTRTRMGQYIAKSIKSSVRALVDSPNVPVNQQDLVNAIVAFMNGLKANLNTDPNHNPFVVNFSISSLAAFNTPTSVAAGNYVVPLNAQIGSAMERIFLNFNFGETVTITSS